jgi:hypothetical protein
MLLLALLLACNPLPPETPIPVDEPTPPRAKPTAPPSEACDVRVYVRALKGPIAVHASPTDDEPVGRLPKPTEEAASGGPILHISEATADGWLHYDGIEGYSTPAPTPRPPASGWVRSPHLAVDLAMSEVNPDLMKPWKVRLRAEPRADAPVVKTYLQQKHKARVLGCRGTWLKARVRVGSAAPATGWLAEYDHCGNPFTTCARSRPEE